jgi:hypothetical protein
MQGGGDMKLLMLTHAGGGGIDIKIQESHGVDVIASVRSCSKGMAVDDVKQLKFNDTGC